MKETIITEQNIKKLVHQFYKKVRADKNLGLVFQNAIGINDQDFELTLGTHTRFLVIYNA